MEPESYMAADESKYKGIRVIYYVLEPEMLKRYLNLVRYKNLLRKWLKHNLK